MIDRTSFTRMVESIVLQSLTGAKQILSASNSYMQRMVADTRQSASDSSNSAAAALASQTAAKASADASAESADNSKSSETKVTALYLSFSRQWYGELDKDPDTDPINGGPPLIGAQYYNLTTKIIRQYTADGWQDYDLDAQHQSQNAALSASQSAASAASAKSQADIATNMANQTTDDRNTIQTIMGPIVVPNQNYSLDYIRVNQAGTAYEVRTPAQVLQDIGGATSTYADELNNAKVNRNGGDTIHGTIVMDGDFNFTANKKLSLLESSGLYASSEYLDAKNSTRVIDINQIGGGNLGWYRFPASGRAYSNAGTFATTTETDQKYDKTGGRIAPTGGGFLDITTGLYMSAYRADSNAGNAIMDFHSDSGGTNAWVASITCDGSFKIVGGGMFIGTATSAEYGDVAEKYTTKERYARGTVLALCTDMAIEETEAAVLGSPVVGVVSTKPGLIINSQLKNGQSIGILGRVPTRVIGAVKRGDPISVSDKPGVATVGTEQIIGYAIDSDAGIDERLVEIFVYPTYSPGAIVK